MASGQKKFMIELPLKIILTEVGTSFFISKKTKLLRFKLADNADEYGIAFTKFSPQSIQRMILLDYVSKIEISMSEFVSKRQEVMDLSKIIVYSILYKQFDRELFFELVKLDCVQKHNRANPSRIIDEETVINDKQLKEMISRSGAVIENLRKYILAPIWDEIAKSKDFSNEEKNIYLLMSEKFLNRLGLLNWYIILLFRSGNGLAEIIEAVRKLLKTYLEKSHIAEYISVMLMELALGSENKNICNAAKEMYPEENDIEMLVLNPEVRSKIVERLESLGQVVFLSWKLGGTSMAIGRQGRLQITLYNKNNEFQKSKDVIEARRLADTHKKNLADFYREMPEGEAGVDLGLYYLSYLDDACKKIGIKFKSLVNQFTDSDLMVIDLVFHF